MAPQEVAPAGRRSKAAAAAAAAAPGAKKSVSSKKKKKNQPGRYSQLVVDTIRKLGERNGSSLAKIYGEAKKVSWFDQQNGRTYLKYSIKALVQNDTLLQVKGVGANGSFRLNKKKLEGLAVPPKKTAPAPKPAAKKPAAPKKSPKKAKPAPKKAKPAPKKSPKKAKPAPKKSPKKAAKPKALRAKKA